MLPLAVSTCLLFCYARDVAAESCTDKVEATPHRRPGLLELFQRASSESDKVWRHGYHRYYDRELAPYRDQEGIRILELGVARGYSLRVWGDYFSSVSALHGVDYATRSAQWLSKTCQVAASPACDIVRIETVDISKVTELDKFAVSERTGWDIIIDDASHVPRHQLSAFKRLFPKLRPGGLYIVEDMETSYVDQGEIGPYTLAGGLGKRSLDNAVERFKDLADVVMRRHFLHPNFTVFGREVDKDVVRVSFGDGIVFIEKRQHTWKNHYPRQSMWTEGSFSRSVRQHEVFLATEESIP